MKNATTTAQGSRRVVRKTASRKIRATDDGSTYEWNGSAWVDVATHLRAAAGAELRAIEAAIAGFDALLSAAMNAKAAGDFPRADRLLARALAIRPAHEGALCVLCSLRRLQQDPERGLEETAAVGATSRYAPLLTSRAAALCDLGRWEEAGRQIEVVLAMGNVSDEALAVVKRIQSEKAFADSDDY